MTNATMDSNIDGLVRTANSLLKDRKLDDRGNKISYIIVTKENGILFNRVSVKTVKGHVVHDKENTATYLPELLLEGIMEYVKRQKNTDFVLLLDESMESFNDQLFLRLKETRIKIMSTETMISRKITFAG